MAFKFEQLRVWQEAVELTGVISSFTKSLPKEELFVLSSQIKWAANSIALNIAEGSTGQTTPEFKRCLEMALGSAFEIETQLTIIKELGLIENDIINKVFDTLETEQKMIGSLISKIKQDNFKNQ